MYVSRASMAVHAIITVNLGEGTPDSLFFAPCSPCDNAVHTDYRRRDFAFSEKEEIVDAGGHKEAIEIMHPANTQRFM